MFKPIALLGFLAASSTPALATILPDNTLDTEDCLFCFNATMSETVFNETIDAVSEVYAPVIEKMGAKLVMNKKWRDRTVNASAIQYGDDWHVNMYGGLARRSEITTDGFTLVVCHELGHHLAGFPFSAEWAANEGESDFFSTHKCAPTLWRDQKEENAKARELIDAVPKKACDEIYSTEEGQDLCYRIALAGKSLATLLGALQGDKPSFDTPDKKTVRRTDHNHPAAQCRLDTYVSGVLCLADYDRDVVPGKGEGNSLKAEQHSAEYHCTASRQYTIGLRPRCWFAPRI